ncbi:MAG: hypothetical protein UU93_C0003G0052 [Candidatus Amesbacteria bacterium GW2011_GWA2_42_12]|uniref:Uncharacterized protein n=1 Tax=Candidatus Amesbacteria bacterium GW2011_GWA2_42_12 TaxID=1618356 RepID=A0A0G0Y8K6_9BACT|nr:MAG: hypothetical protein UU93_C0003G0052 [Candidatus Amesbacteria bacterium GW2011_GWA2_42_12]
MNNPWGDDTGEKMERMATSTVKPIKKAVSDITRDVTDSMGLTQDQSTAGTETPKVVPAGQKQQIKQNDAAKMAQIRQSVANINAQIVEIRKKKEQESRRVEEREKQVKKHEVVEKKKEDSALMKIIKSQKGSKEAAQRASG